MDQHSLNTTRLRWLRWLILALIIPGTLLVSLMLYRQTARSQRRLMRNLTQLEARRTSSEVLQKEEVAISAYVGNPDEAAAGRELFIRYCANCHGEQGKGDIGPDLTDNKWLHGESDEAIFATITRGVPDRGMPAWGQQLSVDDRARLVAFVHELSRKQIRPAESSVGRTTLPDTD